MLRVLLWRSSRCTDTTQKRVPVLRSANSRTRRCDAATRRTPERQVHAAGRVVVLRARPLRAVAQQLEFPCVVEDAGALRAVVGARLDVRRRPDQLIAVIADDAFQRALQADRLPQMPRCGSRGTVRPSRAKFLNCQDTRTTACDLTCHIIRALQPTPAIVSTRSADIEGAHAQRAGTRLFAGAATEHLAYAEFGRLGKPGRAGAGVVGLELGAGVFDPSWPWVMVTWLTPVSGTALTLPLDADVTAEPAEMLAAQQTATRPMTAVAAAALSTHELLLKEHRESAVAPERHPPMQFPQMRSGRLWTVWWPDLSKQSCVGRCRSRSVPQGTVKVADPLPPLLSTRYGCDNDHICGYVLLLISAQIASVGKLRARLDERASRHALFGR